MSLHRSEPRQDCPAESAAAESHQVAARRRSGEGVAVADLVVTRSYFSLLSLSNHNNLFICCTERGSKPVLPADGNQALGASFVAPGTCCCLPNSRAILPLLKSQRLPRAWLESCNLHVYRDASNQVTLRVAVLSGARALSVPTTARLLNQSPAAKDCLFGVATCAYNNAHHSSAAIKPRPGHQSPLTHSSHSRRKKQNKRSSLTVCPPPGQNHRSGAPTIPAATKDVVRIKHALGSWLRCTLPSPRAREQCRKTPTTS
jgi:hypothetical protein